MKKGPELIITISRALLILLFFYASASKIVDPALFKKQMFNQPFPHWMGWGLLFLVPASEILTAVMLMIESTMKKALKGSIVIMGLFTLYTAIVLLHFFRYVPCSCGGVIQKLTWPQHLIFNTFFLGLAITGYILANRADKIEVERRIHSYT